MLDSGMLLVFVCELLMLKLAADLNYDLIDCNLVQLIVGVQYNSVRAPAALIDCKVVINSQHGVLFVKQKGGCRGVFIRVGHSKLYRTASHLENPSSFYPPLISLAKKPEARLLLQSFQGLYGSFLLMYAGGTHARWRKTQRSSSSTNELRPASQRRSCKPTRLFVAQAIEVHQLHSLPPLVAVAVIVPPQTEKNSKKHNTSLYEH
eukprot:scaffold5865_cov84-Skeletonema_dohrnii-CCMP3373.AAC.3